MSKKRILIQGAFILTFTGFLSRLIGFFYRIFLSRGFGEEGVGLYQLIFPIYALGFSLSVAGIETALARSVAHKTSTGKHPEARQLLYVAISVSLFLSCLITVFLQHNALWIARHILGDERCFPLLIVMSYSFPFASLHSCICGYYFGLKQTKIPATSQLIEQFCRVASVYVIYILCMKQNGSVDIAVAAIGLVVGEAASAFFCIKLFLRKRACTQIHTTQFHFYGKRFMELIPLSVPLTANRILLNILQSIEAISIPTKLILYGMTSKQALSTYGVLTGMAMPLILFPSAITNSISTMMLPTVAEVQATNQHEKLGTIIKKVSACCFFLGVFCCVCFLLIGNFFGTAVFHSAAAGKFIITLAWMCPFQYTNTTLISIINGLGKTVSSFLINTFSLLIRISSVFCLIPQNGILGYLWGLLASQLFVTIACVCYLKKQLSHKK